MAETEYQLTVDLTVLTKYRKEAKIPQQNRNYNIWATKLCF